jgi:hypothetical protein
MLPVLLLAVLCLPGNAFPDGLSVWVDDPSFAKRLASVVAGELAPESDGANREEEEEESDKAETFKRPLVLVVKVDKSID